MYYLALVQILTEYQNNKESYPITLECKNGEIEEYDNLSHLKQHLLVCGEPNPYNMVSNSENNMNISMPNIYK